MSIKEGVPESTGRRSDVPNCTKTLTSTLESHGNTPPLEDTTLMKEM